MDFSISVVVAKMVKLLSIIIIIGVEKVIPRSSQLPPSIISVFSRHLVDVSSGHSLHVPFKATFCGARSREKHRAPCVVRRPSKKNDRSRVFRERRLCFEPSEILSPYWLH